MNGDIQMLHERLSAVEMIVGRVELSQPASLFSLPDGDREPDFTTHDDPGIDPSEEVIKLSKLKHFASYVTASDTVVIRGGRVYLAHELKQTIAETEIAISAETYVWVRYTQSSGVAVLQSGASLPDEDSQYIITPLVRIGWTGTEIDIADIEVYHEGDIHIGGGGVSVAETWWFTYAGTSHTVGTSEPSGVLQAGAFWMSILVVGTGTGDGEIAADSGKLILKNYQRCLPV